MHILHHAHLGSQASLHVPSVLFWRAGAALHGRLQKIDVFLKANRSFCPELVWVPAPNAKQLLGKQFQRTKGSRMGEQSSQPPPMAPGHCTVSSQKSQQITKLIGKPPGSLARGSGGLAGGIPPQEVTACFVVAKIHFWRIILRGLWIYFAATGGAVLVGQEAEECMGPVPGVSPAGAVPHGCSPEPPQNSQSISTIPGAFVRVPQEQTLCPQTGTPCPGGCQGRGLGSAQSAPKCFSRSSHLPLPTNGGDFHLLSSGKPPAKLI